MAVPVLRCIVLQYRQNKLLRLGRPIGVNDHQAARAGPHVDGESATADALTEVVRTHLERLVAPHQNATRVLVPVAHDLDVADAALLPLRRLAKRVVPEQLGAPANNGATHVNATTLSGTAWRACQRRRDARQRYAKTTTLF